MVSIEEYRQKGTIKDINPNEKQQYLNFLNDTYKDNVKASEFLLLKFPRWSIISGYYAMHDISKLFLGKNYNLKLNAPSVHVATIQALRELIKRTDILELMKQAEKEYDQIISLHLALLQGKDQREKSQYYTLQKVETTIQQASFFLEKIVKPYLQLLEELTK